MKSSFILLSLCLSLLDITNSAPVQIDQGLRLTPLNDRTYDVVDSLVIDPEQAESRGTLVRRAGRGKGSPPTPLTAEKKKTWAELTSGNNKGGASTGTKGKEVADKQAAVDTKKATVKDRRKKKKAVDAQLTPEQKAQREAKLAPNQQQREDQKKDKDGNTVWLDINEGPSDREITAWWNDFSTLPVRTRNSAACEIRELKTDDFYQKGKDGKGFVKLDAIAAAFRRCVPRDTVLFWSASGDKGFEWGAIPKYVESSKRTKISVAVLSDPCKTDLASMQRSEMIKMFDLWMDDWKKTENIKKHTDKHPKDKNKIFKYKFPTKVREVARGKLNYDNYWAVMSAGYAAGARGSVHYFRPDRRDGETGDFPGTHWVNYELPELKKNSQVTYVEEVTMASTGGKKASYRNSVVNPETTIRVGTKTET